MSALMYACSAAEADWVHKLTPYRADRVGDDIGAEDLGARDDDSVSGVVDTLGATTQGPPVALNSRHHLPTTATENPVNDMGEWHHHHNAAAAVSALLEAVDSSALRLRL